MTACVGALLVAVGVAGATHGAGHLPATAVNVELVGKLRLTAVGNGVGDVAARKGFAYLAAWRPECPRGGVHVVDVRTPAAPRKISFVAAPAGYYVGEGVHLISPQLRAFRGDLLLTNHEACPGNEQPASGGFSLTDVTDPANPKPLSGLVGDRRAPDGATRPVPNSSHSVQGWIAKGKAYALLVDNVERGDDVDIFDISNPRAVRQIAEVGLSDWPTANRRPARGNNAFLHDVQVQKIAGHWYALLSYWDAGWILLNLDNPARPRLARDHDFVATEAFSGLSPSEGNAHQAFWSSDRKLIVAASEDFTTYRGRLTIASGSSSGQTLDTYLGATAATPAYFRSSQLGAEPLATYFVGRACSPAPVPRAPAPRAIALVERGVCGLLEKATNAETAGYAAAIIFNGAGPGGCESQPAVTLFPGVEIPVFTITRSAGLKLFDVAGYSAPACLAGSSPALPAVGARVASAVPRVAFDGWGGVTLLDAKTLATLRHFAVPESVDESFASGFGTLSVHEVKTDPRPGVNLAYLSYYGAGARVLSFSRSGVREVGRFIDQGGNNFWGTFPVAQGSAAPLWLLSDMDYGLYILRYTGPTRP